MLDTRFNNAVVIAAIAIGVVAVALIVVTQLDDDPDPVPLPESELEAPMPLPESPATDDATDRIVVDTAELHWTSEQGTRLLEGPTIDDMEWEWTGRHSEGWNLQHGHAQSDHIDLESRIWTASGLELAIIDVEAQLSGDAVARPLTVTTTVPGDDGELLTGSLERATTNSGLDDHSVLAGRFGSSGPTVHIHAPDGTVGHSRSSGDQLAIDWPLWPGLDAIGDCLDDNATQHVSMRLLVGIGDAPVASALSIPAETRMVSTPIFVDPSTLGMSHLADAQADSPQDLSRRLRALAYGHSDRDDPRYGNGGLLAHNLGGLFAIPARWWNDPAIEQLRSSLDGSSIEVIPDGPVAGDSSSRSTVLADLDDCAALTAGDDNELPATIIIPDLDTDAPIDTPVAAPFDPVVSPGVVPSVRSELLERLFEVDAADGLAARGTRRSALVPVVATRNPLVDIASDGILSPDRNGHWNLDDALARRLTRLDFDADTHRRHTTGFASLRQRLDEQSESLAHWTADGDLSAASRSGDLRDLYFLGDLEFDGDVSGDGFVTWRFDDSDMPAIDEPPAAVVFEFE